jgi:hypothetical protein
MFDHRRISAMTLMAAAGLAASAAPASADTAVCEVDGPAKVAYEQSGHFIFDRGYAYVRSEGQLRCTGTMGGMLVSAQPVPYALSGHVSILEDCALADGGALRLDARLQPMISIGHDSTPLTADLSPSGWNGAGSIAGIAGMAQEGLDVRGSILQSAGWCADGMLRLRLTFNDGDSRPNRGTDAAETPPATAPSSAPAPKRAVKSKKTTKKRCAKRNRRSAKKTPRRCGRRR